MVDLRQIAERDHAFPRTVFIHLGSKIQADSFFATYWPNALAIGNPKQILYRAFGIGIGSVGQFLKPDVWKAYWSNRSHGIGAPVGNTMRNPGAVLIAGTKVLYAQQCEHFGVQVDVAAVTSAIASET